MERDETRPSSLAQCNADFTDQECKKWECTLHSFFLVYRPRFSSLQRDPDQVQQPCTHKNCPLLHSNVINKEWKNTISQHSLTTSRDSTDSVFAVIQTSLNHTNTTCSWHRATFVETKGWACTLHTWTFMPHNNAIKWDVNHNFVVDLVYTVVVFAYEGKQGRRRFRLILVMGDFAQTCRSGTLHTYKYP